MTKEQELKVMALEDHYIDALKKGELDDYPDGYFTTERLTALMNPNYKIIGKTIPYYLEVVEKYGDKVERG